MTGGNKGVIETQGILKCRYLENCRVYALSLIHISGYDSGAIDFLLYFGKEIFIGFLLGYVFNVFYYMLITAGDILDMNFGFAMAKIFDPATNIQSAFTANILNLSLIHI